MPRPSRPALALVLVVLGVGHLEAQFPPLTVPRGLFRAELSGSFLSTHQRLRSGTDEALGTDFVTSALGRDFWPALEPADSLIRKITELSDPRLNLGATSASHQVTTGTLGLGLAYGLTNRITLFTQVPIVRVKVRSTFELNGETGTSGFNPADPRFGTAEGLAQTTTFFSQFDAAIASLQAKLAAGEYNGDPTLLALAQSTLGNATTLRNDLQALIVATGTASPFLPLGTSAAGTVILGKVGGLQGILSGSLGVGGFTEIPALPAATLSNEDLDNFITDLNGPVAGLLETPSLSALGDIEVGVAMTLYDRLNAVGASGFRVSAQGLVRLPTAFLSDPNRYFDVGTGDKQTDVEGTFIADGVFGRVGARAVAGYSLQLAGSANRRITRPDQPMPWVDRFATISRNPGDMLMVGVTPMIRLAPTLALTGGVLWRHKGADVVTLGAGQEEIPGASPSELALETDGSWTTATVGLTYSVPATMQGDTPQRPLDAGVVWESIVSSSGPLRVTKNAGIKFWLRLYSKLF
jgi:hypothetical protein